MIEDIINGYDIFRIKQSMLKKIDKDLVDHGLETAYIACLIGEQLGYEGKKLCNLRIAALIHDIGAYKTEEMNNLKQFEIVDTGKHAIYGYSILNQMKELNNIAPIILYHHHSYDNRETCIDDIQIPEEAFIISLADRVSIFCRLLNYEEDKIIQVIHNLNKNSFKPKHLEILYELIDSKHVIKNITDSSYKKEINKTIKESKLGLSIMREFLIFLPLAIDFFSFETSLHTVSISSMASKICEKMNLAPIYKRKIEVGAYLHDLGKVCMPTKILHKQDRLTEEEFYIMKKHVTYTREILIESKIEKELVDLACNHHEKLDGTGYDRGLKEEELSIGDRIISISDIFCALTEKRKYKDSFDKNKVLGILFDMANKNQIDRSIVNLINENYEEIFETVANTKRDYNNTLKDILKDYSYILEKNINLNIL
ncbi:HD domain-containing phosphohydrolase [Romboutsia sp.]|uniref:HD domain-containing phosphohydrolase n=1 Tax=Romboutsia sp. TaxID=1965302 RepID=UPI003F3A7372